jgi:DNA-binding HxlR family transcriptional regulator
MVLTFKLCGRQNPRNFRSRRLRVHDNFISTLGRYRGLSMANARSSLDHRSPESLDLRPTSEPITNVAEIDLSCRAIEQLHGKWKLRILCRMRCGPVRLGRLSRELRPASKKVLTQSLRQLQVSGLIVRRDQGGAVRVSSTVSLSKSARSFYFLRSFYFFSTTWLTLATCVYQQNSRLAPRSLPERAVRQPASIFRMCEVKAENDSSCRSDFAALRTKFAWLRAVNSGNRSRAILLESGSQTVWYACVRNGT